MPLRSIKVLEFAGLAPVPFCGMILADFGATVIRVDRTDGTPEIDPLSNGKQSLSINLKHTSGVDIVKKLSKTFDVILDPYRPGVLEKLHLGPKDLMPENPKLIFARLSGYGQSGCMQHAAGHDINYLAVSGLLSLLGRKHEKPYFPINLLADFGGGGLICALGILIALLERHTSGRGQIIDSSMVEGSAYLASWIIRSQNFTPLWPNRNVRGANMLDGGAPFYDVYETRDRRHVAVGAIEPQFYASLLRGLQLTDDEAPQFGHFDRNRKLFTQTFLTKTRQEWCDVFKHLDACVTPVLTVEEAANTFPHNVQRKSFNVCPIDTDDKDRTPTLHCVPKPAPHLSRTPAATRSIQPPSKTGQETFDILTKYLNYSPQEIQHLQRVNAIKCHL